jgi:FXSXX-COOH protein
VIEKGRGTSMTEQDRDVESDLPDLAAMTLPQLDEIDHSVLANSLRRLVEGFDDEAGTLSSFNAAI